MAAKDAAMGYQIMSINVDSLSLAAPLPARTLLLALGHVLRSGVPQPQRLLAPRGRSFLVRHSAYIDCRSPLLRASPDSEYPFAKEVSQNKMPNWARSEYRNHIENWRFGSGAFQPNNGSTTLITCTVVSAGHSRAAASRAAIEIFIVLPPNIE